MNKTQAIDAARANHSDIFRYKHGWSFLQHDSIDCPRTSPLSRRDALLARATSIAKQVATLLGHDAEAMASRWRSEGIRNLGSMLATIPGPTQKQP